MTPVHDQTTPPGRQQASKQALLLLHAMEPHIRPLASALAPEPAWEEDLLQEARAAVYARIRKLPQPLPAALTDALRMQLLLEGMKAINRLLGELDARSVEIPTDPELLRRLQALKSCASSDCLTPKRIAAALGIGARGARLIWRWLRQHEGSCQPAGQMRDDA